RGRGAMSEAAAMAAAAPVAPMAEARLRRKQLLSAEEAELFELAQAAGSGLDPEVFRPLSSSGTEIITMSVILELIKKFLSCTVLSWMAEIALVKSSCTFSLPGGRNKTSSAVSGTQILSERSSREGSAQRMPRQPSVSRIQKAGTSGKNSGGGNS
ncbi:MZT2A protein, partial [Daphoenositta chrysoptera]|nr:MZT2A protein [Daphoenositta chrysoptera]